MYAVYQREGRTKNYVKYQRGDGLRTMMVTPPFIRRRRRRRIQRGKGFGSFIRKVGKAIVTNPIVKKVAKDFILPMAVGAIHQKMGGKRV